MQLLQNNVDLNYSPAQWTRGGANRETEARPYAIIHSDSCVSTSIPYIIQNKSPCRAIHAPCTHSMPDLRRIRNTPARVLVAHFQTIFPLSLGPAAENEHPRPSEICGEAKIHFSAQTTYMQRALINYQPGSYIQKQRARINK